MNTKLKFLLLVGFMICYNISFSQQENHQSSNTEISKIYYYKFQGQLIQSEIDHLRSEVSKMLFVTEVKIEYKAEKALGQLRVLTKERFIDTDTDFQFNIYELTNLLNNNNLIPVEYTSEVISN